MLVRQKTRRRLKWAAGIAAGGLVLLLLAAMVLWMATQRVPAWYRPIDVSAAELSRVRNSLPNTYQDLTDEIMKGETFDFVLSDKLVTEWIVARGELYPEARGWLPDWFRDPIVHFGNGRCIIGARLYSGVWQAIVGIHLKADVTNEAITIRIDKVTAGSVPLPLSQFEEPLEKLLNDKRLDPDLMPDPLSGIVRRLQEEGPHALLVKGITWPNIFETVNGKRLVKIRGLSAENGELHIRIEPR
jgi:hypothetical protein